MQIEMEYNITMRKTVEVNSIDESVKALQDSDWRNGRIIVRKPEVLSKIALDDKTDAPVKERYLPEIGDSLDVIEVQPVKTMDEWYTQYKRSMSELNRIHPSWPEEKRKRAIMNIMPDKPKQDEDLWKM